MKKRILSVFAVVLLTALLFTGCGRDDNEPALSPTAAPSATPDPHAGQVEVTDGSGGVMWVNLTEELVPFSMDRSKFSVSDGRAYYAGAGYALKLGIDVSDHQNEIDWQAVADSGVEFVILRCGWRGYTAGGLNEDEYFRQNYRSAKEAGLDVGVYFFSQAVSVEEALEEAEFVLETLDGYALTMPIVYDWEYISDEARTAAMDRRTLTDCSLAFLRRIEEAGYWPMLYYNTHQVRDLLHLSELEEYDCWLALYSDLMTFPYRIKMWQYTCTGTIPGIEGDVDINLFFPEA